MRTFMQWLVHVIVPVLIGGVIYIGFRSQTLLMFSWFNSIGIGEFITTIRIYISNSDINLPSWVIFSIPDGLWVYSLSSALLLVNNGRFTVWTLVPLIIGVFLELAQAMALFKGTYDLIDLFITIFFYIVSILILKSNNKSYAQTVS
jgi:hypothetical protein